MWLETDRRPLEQIGHTMATPVPLDQSLSVTFNFTLNLAGGAEP